MDIWNYAEVGYQEERSSALLQSKLQAAGFDVESGVAGMPTAFIASWGEGTPVIAILAEYDALPGLSQLVATERKDAGGPAGHACGHHLSGTASTAAAVAVKEWLQKSGTRGTVRLYGTPAEEGGAGKVYMVREGLFEDVDVSIGWHPGDENDASPVTSLANISTKFRFYGRSAHAAGAPEQGRSALDAVESLNYMVNLMREHVDSTTRIHYVITRGGEAPNVVPDFAEVYYYTRHPDVVALRGIWGRVHKAAEGAVLGTGTRMEYEIIHGTPQRDRAPTPRQKSTRLRGNGLYRRISRLHREDPRHARQAQTDRLPVRSAALETVDGVRFFRRCGRELGGSLR